MQIPGYRIIRKINQGGMSTVYLAIQLSVGREVALKVMSPALNADPVFSERFQREANIVGQLSHPNIVSVYDIGRFKNLNYIAMDYLAGGSIHDRMKAGLSAVEALRITSQIANSLDHAHEKGYIHRDIKPENILFREDGTAVLSDFGVAKTVSTASNMTNAGTVVGTPHYMSPEQARGKPIDGRADLYSLGVVFYEMITGSVPYTAEEAVAIAIKHLTAPIPKLPPQYTMFQPFLNKLLAKDPNDRFQRGREVVEAIAQLQGTSRGTTPTYLTETDPTAIQILSLFKALVLTSYAAIAAQAKLAGLWLASWRWTPKRGVYRHPRVTVTEIRTSAETVEEDRATIISTRVQKAAHYQSLENRRIARIYRGLMLGGLLGIIWIAFSMGMGRLIDNRDTVLPNSLQAAIISTNRWVERLLLAEGEQQPARDHDIEAVSAETTEAPPAASLPASAALAEPPATASVQPASPPPPPPRFGLKVNASPIDAKVRVLNIRERYYTGIPLLPGRYQVEVTAEGHDRDVQWVEITNQPLTLDVSLRKIPVPGATFHNELADGSKGPAMVIVRQGSFEMGNSGDAITSPTRRVRLAQPFAISQYEITFADYDKFAQATKRPLPPDGQWGRGSRPVINVSWEDARAYAKWLRDSTGRKYRLPTEAEWEYAARAGTGGDYWWQGSADGKANCRRGCNSKFSNLFRTKTAPVGSYPANGFSIFDTAGNVAEWVEDCYQPHYLAAPRDGSAVVQNGCAEKVVRGGSIRNSAEELKSYYRDHRDGRSVYNDVGIRVVVDLY
ncbi:bifunctional serine/threonine-protein kinase/formylglycine-generating enzyme family protein [Pseudomaricurvus sp. HS19]|uniref:bifunctional serine/threonine-protein kinase/formylglycine-generating enzyme family protein n=1 Tax=Pseudomaricurvus sp. HS19 TaxID=2692626 RepID=UPI00136B9885|nr:bifunctional serine/threonine-protein kinase/formylglycine-generating enzyme family protein [Pseudomaricurvus sp. HS19]MYM62114.1 SUMF1/EgtB/PvdO family nonheme iron enzyme [Pseudomaricurvus sp. HS19]